MARSYESVDVVRSGRRCQRGLSVRCVSASCKRPVCSESDVRRIEPLPAPPCPALRNRHAVTIFAMSI
jgi:hypothetical protein